MTLYRLDDATPEISKDGAWVAPDAAVIGRVKLLPRSLASWQKCSRPGGGPEHAFREIPQKFYRKH